MAVEQLLVQEFPLISLIGNFTATVYGIRTSTSYASNVVKTKILPCHVHSNQAVGQIYHAIYVTVTCEYAHTTKVSSNRTKPWHIHNSVALFLIANAQSVNPSPNFPV